MYLRMIDLPVVLPIKSCVISDGDILIQTLKGFIFRSTNISRFIYLHQWIAFLLS